MSLDNFTPEAPAVNGPEDMPAFRTWSDLKNAIKGLEDFITPREQEELRAMHAAGTLPDNVDPVAIERYISFQEELLAGINQNRLDGGLPVLEGRVLSNAITGSRWMRSRRDIKAFVNMTTLKVFAEGDPMAPTINKWGHRREAHLREESGRALSQVDGALCKGLVLPPLRLVREHYTYKGTDNIPYGYAYSIRLEPVTQQIDGPLLEDLAGSRFEDLAEMVFQEFYRDQPERFEHQRPFVKSFVMATLKAIALLPLA